MNDGKEMTAADKMRRDLGYADAARKRAREIESMLHWLGLSTKEQTLLVRVPKHSRFGSDYKTRELDLTKADQDALMEFLTKRAEHEYDKANGIDAYCLREAARQQKKQEENKP